MATGYELSHFQTLKTRTRETNFNDAIVGQSCIIKYMKNMNKIIFIFQISITLLLLASCGQSKATKVSSTEYIVDGQDVSSEYQDIKNQALDEVYQATGVSIHDQQIKIVYISSPTAEAICYGLDNDTKAFKTIGIDINRFKNIASEAKKIAVMQHEIGHCFFGKNHAQDKISIMLPSLSQAFVRFNAGTREQRIELLKEFSGADMVSF
jgi:hypothetical protein